jgi:putative membrane protein
LPAAGVSPHRLSTDVIAAAYCGPAPLPAELPARWNTDPWLLAALAGLAVAMAVSSRAADRRRRAAFAAAWGLLVIAFVSPLCAATVALFSARTVHHLLLVAGAAPLLALAGVGRGARHPAGWPLLGAMAMLYAWHLPPLYASALASPAIYWLMQLSLLGSAIVFWAAVFDPRQPPLAALPALMAAVALMGLLGALLTFAPRVLYEAHALAPRAYGLEPLDDQRLAGLLMWGPATLPYLAFAAVLGRRAFAAAGARA